MYNNVFLDIYIYCVHVSELFCLPHDNLLKFAAKRTDLTTASPFFNLG